MSRPIVVVKVGGSLLDLPELPARLGEVLAHPDLAPCRTLLVPGGGAFVDVLRRLDAVHGFGDPTAHALAVHALDFNARVLARIGRASRLRVVESLETAARRWAEGDVPVLAPRLELARMDRTAETRLPETWDVTSDTIAARLAARAGSDTLVLLKSVNPPPEATRADASTLGLVDPHFAAAARPLPRVLCANLRAAGPLALRAL
jgi:aspartokinase-like uncharacterized kinase